ncbi:hypothetical protein F5X96DRAFT_669502 [Biscogniauxia mediterranea]|nr:hypothetical protein F5X96DRAFT_669502 [Biscogniauxia mediterranea]
MTSFQDSYVTDTSPYPYDQIIVLSQKVINAGFKNMWKIAQGDDDSPLKHFKKTSHGEYIDSDVGVPSVKVHVESRGPILYFLLSLTRGELVVYENDDSDNLLKFDIKDWILAFNVYINQKKITKDSDKYKEFKKRAGLPESNFSLVQLFIDSSSKFNEALTTFGDHSLDGLTPSTRARVIDFITNWLLVMSQEGNSILGYSAQREENDELNKYAPSFPPTSIDYFPYPWLGASGNGSAKDGQDENSLSYLMMSNFTSRPAQGAIPYTGPWTNGGSRGASFCMGRPLFWGWLLSLMRKLSMAMTPIPEEPYVAYVGKPDDMPWRYGWTWHIGDSDAKDDDYKWIPSGQNAWQAKSSDKYSFSRADHPHEKNDYETAEEWSENIEATVSFNAGKEVVNLGGSSTFTFMVKLRTSWSISVYMTSIEEGGIIFQTRNKGTADVKIIDVVDTMKLGDTPDAIAAELADDLKSNVSTVLDSIEDKLVNALANANRLCLPAAGTFFMKDPIFNQNGDLLVSLAYDGADPPPPPPKDKYKLLMH